MSAKRHCPALERTITSAECGAKRGSAIRCPAQCPHNPFGTVALDTWLKVDFSFNPKAAAFCLKRVEAALLADLLATIGHQEETEPEKWQMLNVITFVLTRGTDQDGRNVGALWEAEGYPGLNNDERVMAGYHRGAFVTVIEIQRLLNPHTFEAIDVFQPERGSFVVVDRTMAPHLHRFDRILTWLVHYDEVARTLVQGAPVPLDGWSEWRSFVEERFQKSRADHKNLTGFLTRHFIDARNFIHAVGMARRERILNTLDFHHCIASYVLNCPADRVLAELTAKPDFQPGAAQAGDGFDKPVAFLHWLRRGQARELEAEMPSAMRHGANEDDVGGLATVRLYPDRLVLSTVSKQKFEFAKNLLMTYCPGLLRFERESITDLAKQMRDRVDAEEEHPVDEALSEQASLINTAAWGSRSRSPEARRSVPSRPVPPDVAKTALDEFYRKRYAKFLDEPIPMLGDLTPRQAAHEPARRSELVELMKIHLNGIDEQRRKQNLNIDINWILDELGLSDLK